MAELVKAVHLRCTERKFARVRVPFLAFIIIILCFVFVCVCVVCCVCFVFFNY